MAEETFLVTGSEGCIGSWVVKNLVERDDRCVALDLASGATRLRKLLPDEQLRDVAFVVGDIAEEGLVARAVAEHGVTRIVHLAALQIPFVAADPIRGALVNVVGTLRVLEAARSLREQVAGVVYASSAAVFGPEGTERAPATLYGVFKVCNEDCARVFWQDFGVPSVGLRPWAIFGPGRDQGLTAAPTHAMKAAALGLEYRIPFGGRLDLQYAEDVAEAFVRAALAAADGAPVYNLRGSVVGVDRLVSVIEDVWPDARGLITHGEEAIPIEPELDADGLPALVGALPSTELRVAVRKTIEHFDSLRKAGRLEASEVPRS